MPVENNHLVLSILQDKSSSLLSHLTAPHPNEPLVDSSLIQTKAQEDLLFLVDALIRGESFMLTAEDIKKIWQAALELFPQSPPYHLYALVEIVTSAYVLRELNGDEWEAAIRYFLAEHHLPETITNSSTKLASLAAKMAEVTASLAAITEERLLIAGEVDDNVEDVEQRRRVIDAILENWPNGIFVLNALIQAHWQNVDN